ncbi:MAG: aldo/keto reductase, partial [Chloroflexi bacterium]|nr:aldo/keto reductase [Chloroflexota bacterium]
MTTLPTRPLGKTGLQISEIVFGAGAVGGGVFRGERDERLETVRHARDGGSNWIDTAPGYGNGQSEENLAWILRDLDWQGGFKGSTQRVGEHQGSWGARQGGRRWGSSCL